MSQQIEALQEAIKQLTGAINQQIEFSKKLEQRLKNLEERNITENITQPTLPTPKNEQELKDISKLPDSVKELQVFDGNPTQYVSWIHTVESILKDYDIVRNKPIYRAILQSIRQKIRGNADSALISYNIFDDDWTAIKKCLSLHYADKRDLRTLEYQLSNLTQRNSSIDQFYANVNHQFSLIVNKIKTEEYTAETINVLVETYRNRALDVFIRGLNGELSKMLMIQKPNTLPEAYSSCLEMQNLNYRNLPIHNRNFKNSVVAPINQVPIAKNESPHSRRPPNQLSFQQKNLAYNIQHQQNHRPLPPPRPDQPKPPVPMKIDRSIQTRQVNYMNRPPGISGNIAYKRDNDSDGHARKQQRVFHMETRNDNQAYEDYIQQFSDYEDYQEEDQDEEENQELNFMMGASLSFHT